MNTKEAHVNGFEITIVRKPAFEAVGCQGSLKTGQDGSLENRPLWAAFGGPAEALYVVAAREQATIC